MEPVIIQSPVKGSWSFMNPPSHHPDAKDFVAVAWEKDVFSQFKGTVVDVSNNMNDRKYLNLCRDLIKGLVLAPRNKNKGIGFFLGNYIIIESAEGIFALFAHLKKESILVKKGQSVESGELIAQVGNSGNTIQPHLHFQLMAENDPSKSIPVPFLLESCQRNKQENLVGLPNNYESFKV